MRVRSSSAICLACLLALTLAVRAVESADKSNPNVILILSDDMGYSDLPKFEESEIPTPAIDRLAEEGTLFANAYVRSSEIRVRSVRSGTEIRDGDPGRSPNLEEC